MIRTHFFLDSYTSTTEHNQEKLRMTVNNPNLAFTKLNSMPLQLCVIVLNRSTSLYYPEEMDQFRKRIHDMLQVDLVNHKMCQTLR